MRTSQGSAPSGSGAESAKAKTTAEVSGTKWVSRFPGGNSLRDLRGSFRSKAEAYVDALRSAGATVSISATHRPPQRAYLMHWSWRIVKRDLDPAAVPAMEAVDINWVHDGADGKYSREASVAAAKAMVNGFNIQSLGVAPALQSRHTMGCAIDMNIRWTGELVMPDADGKVIRIDTFPHSGMNKQLHRVGASYRVIKYNRGGRDEPDWSDNGA